MEQPDYKYFKMRTQDVLVEKYYKMWRKAFRFEKKWKNK